MLNTNTKEFAFLNIYDRILIELNKLDPDDRGNMPKMVYQWENAKFCPTDKSLQRVCDMTGMDFLELREHTVSYYEYYTGQLLTTVHAEVMKLLIESIPEYYKNSKNPLDVKRFDRHYKKLILDLLVSKGFTYTRISELMGITRATLNTYRNY